MEITRDSGTFNGQTILPSTSRTLYGKKQNFLLAPRHICIHNEPFFLNFRFFQVNNNIGNIIGEIVRGSWPPNRQNLMGLNPIVIIRPSDSNILGSPDILDVDVDSRPQPRPEFPTLKGETVQIQGTDITGTLLDSTQGDVDLIDRTQNFPGTSSRVSVYLVDFSPNAPGDPLIGSPVILPNNGNQLLGMLVDAADETKSFIYPAHFAKI